MGICLQARKVSHWLFAEGGDRTSYSPRFFSAYPAKEEGDENNSAFQAENPLTRPPPWSSLVMTIKA